MRKISKLPSFLGKSVKKILLLLFFTGATSGMDFFKSVRNGDIKQVQVILNFHENNIFCKDEGGLSALHRSKSSHMTEFLIMRGAVVDAENNGWTPLLGAAIDGQKDIVELLLRHRASVDQQDLSGNTALHDATKCGYKDIVKQLLDSKASVTIKNSQGKIALDLLDSAGTFWSGDISYRDKREIEALFQLAMK